MRRVDIQGELFGKLTVESVAGTIGRSRLWLCRCVCGAKALRKTEQLLRSRREGQVPACRKCLIKLAGNRAERTRTRKGRLMLRNWLGTGTLWSTRDLELLQSEIRQEVGEELGGWSTRMDKLPVAVDFDYADEFFVDTCLETLEDVGAELGVTRERVRQIQEIAFAKLRRSPILQDLYFGEGRSRGRVLMERKSLDETVEKRQKG